jgi:hypothetical protein
MEQTNKSLLSVDSLDFNTIKNDLSTFLSSQELFKDYNFRGSGLSILLDILAYNTHHMAFYANMISNESFLDSSILRNSAVSLSKAIGYVPRSRTGAEIVVDVEVFPNNPTDQANLAAAASSNLMKISKNEVFRTSFGGKNFFFYAADNFYFTFLPSQGKAVARNVILREGRLKTQSFIVNRLLGNERYIIEDPNIDTRSISLFVRKSFSESEGFSIPWKRSTSILDNGANERVYFLQEAYDGKYEIYFGDGVIGRDVQQGNIILVTYASCEGEEGNEIGLTDRPNGRAFIYIPSPSFTTNVDNYTTTTIVKRDELNNPVPSFGGQEKETIDSIKYYAPRFYETQDRAVTLNDYITLLQSNYSGSIKSIHAWGGEENDPPEYGKVFISVKPISGLFLSTQEKINLEKTILGERNIVSITPRVVDPDYLFLSPRINVKFDPRRTTVSSEILRDQVSSYVREYGLENLSAFEKSFFSGRLISNITNLNSGIKSCTLDVSITKKFTPRFNSSFSYTTNFENSLTPLEDEVYIRSSSFIVLDTTVKNILGLPRTRAFFQDNGKGNISLLRESDLEVMVEKYGTVDYETGKINIRSTNFLLPENLERYEVSITAKPKDLDIISKRNTIIEFDSLGIEIALSAISSLRM